MGEVNYSESALIQSLRDLGFSTDNLLDLSEVFDRSKELGYKQADIVEVIGHILSIPSEFEKQLQAAKDWPL